MVGNDLQGNILLQVVLVFHSSEAGSLLDDRLEQVGVEVGVYILQDGSQTLQARTGINVLIRKRCIAAVLVMVELGEHEVPHFQPAFIFTARIHFRITHVAAVSFAAVIEYFRARTARAFADIPEVLIAQLDDALSRQANLFIPQLECFFILGVHRNGNAVPVEADPFLAGQELPGPGNRFFLEIISDGEVAQHLEERMVAACLADILNIIGADTFLGVRQAGILRNLPSVKVRLQRRHPGIDP